MAPTRWCRWSGSRSCTTAGVRAGHAGGRPRAALGRGRARRATWCCGRAARSGPAELAVAASVGPRSAALRRPPARGRAGDRRRAGGARRAARARTDPRLEHHALRRLAERAGARSLGRERGARRSRGHRARRSAGALEGADVVCVSGGVSVGPHDHVKPALPRWAWRSASGACALKPGKPTWFGTRGEHARVRPAGQPGVGDGHLPPVRAPGAARAGRAPTPTDIRASARARRAGRPQLPSATRCCAAG